jgi:2-iminobutanoate/2-iminopropanoate deaminase
LPQSEHSAREREPGSYAIYKKTGVFPEQTMFYKELQLTLKPAENPDGSRTEPSGRGYFPGVLAGAEVSARIRSACRQCRLEAPTSTVTRHGDTINVTGAPPFEPNTGEICVDSNRTPDRARAEQLKLCVETAGSSLENILKVNVYVTSVEMFPAVNEVYRRYFPKDPPARIFVNVPAWNGGFDIEVDCIAAV